MSNRWCVTCALLVSRAGAEEQRDRIDEMTRSFSRCVCGMIADTCGPSGVGGDN